MVSNFRCCGVSVHSLTERFPGLREKLSATVIAQMRAVQSDRIGLTSIDTKIYALSVFSCQMGFLRKQIGFVGQSVRGRHGRPEPEAQPARREPKAKRRTVFRTCLKALSTMLGMQLGIGRRR